MRWINIVWDVKVYNVLLERIVRVVIVFKFLRLI